MKSTAFEDQRNAAEMNTNRLRESIKYPQKSSQSACVPQPRPDQRPSCSPSAKFFVASFTKVSTTTGFIKSGTASSAGTREGGLRARSIALNCAPSQISRVNSTGSLFLSTAEAVTPGKPGIWTSTRTSTCAKML